MGNQDEGRIGTTSIPKIEAVIVTVILGENEKTVVRQITTGL
jgi:hypothetical protein